MLHEECRYFLLYPLSIDIRITAEIKHRLMMVKEFRKKNDSDPLGFLLFRNKRIML